ncbi:Hypothetical protein A7982_06593 [Minicystis rosea]|nr:Hypothetical protein A7982_06593 [Minicystis rosea]
MIHLASERAEQRASLHCLEVRLDRLAAALAVVVSASCGAASARAQSTAPTPPARTSSLGWVRLAGAEPCVPPRALAIAVERRLGRPALVPPAQADVAIEGRIERANDGWRATILLTDGSGAQLGRRELASKARDCRALDDEIALVIALLIDPSAALAPRAPALVDTLVPPPLPAALPPPAPASAPPSWHFGVTAGAALGFGLLPRVGSGIALRAHVVPARWPSIEIGAVVWPGHTITAGPVSAGFTLAYGTLAVCPGLTLAGTLLEACAGVHAGALRVGGFGFALSYQQEQIVIDATVEARVRRRIVGPLLIAGGASMVVPMRRDRFYYLDAQGAERDVFQMSPVAGVLDLGLGVELP